MQQHAANILFYCNITLHVSGAVHTNHQDYIKLQLQPPIQVIYLRSTSLQRGQVGHVGVR